MGIGGEEQAKATSSGCISSILFYQSAVVFLDLPLTLQSCIFLTVLAQLHVLIDYWLIENGVFPEVDIDVTTEFNNFVYFGGSLSEKFETFEISLYSSKTSEKYQKSFMYFSVL